MGSTVSLSKLVESCQRMLEEKGDMKVFIGDMRELHESDVQAFEAPHQEKYGKNFLHIGGWPERTV